MKPYITWHNTGVALGIFIGKIPPHGQWDISLSLIFFSIGLRSEQEVSQEEVKAQEDYDAAQEFFDRKMRELREDGEL